jgi:hypothetical protein
MEIKNKNIVNDSSLPNVSGLNVFKLKKSIREKQLAIDNNAIVKK